MNCWSCDLQLPAGARFCARCGVRQRSAGPAAAYWVLAAFAIGACIAGLAAIVYGVILLNPAYFLSPNPKAIRMATCSSSRGVPPTAPSPRLSKRSVKGSTAANVSAISICAT